MSKFEWNGKLETDIDYLNTNNHKISVLAPLIKEAITLTDIDAVIELTNTGKWIALEVFSIESKCYFHMARVI